VGTRAVAGMALASLRKDRAWLTLFEQAGGSLQIVATGLGVDPFGDTIVSEVHLSACRARTIRTS
jgi:hypothetical protein